MHAFGVGGGGCAADRRGACAGAGALTLVSRSVWLRPYNPHPNPEPLTPVTPPLLLLQVVTHYRGLNERQWGMLLRVYGVAGPVLPRASIDLYEESSEAAGGGGLGAGGGSVGEGKGDAEAGKDGAEAEALARSPPRRLSGFM